MSEQYFEMLWDCAQCDARDLLAKTHRHCPHCGAAQDPGTRRFPEPGQEAEAKDHRFVGKDWFCGYCESPNSAASAFCGNCGAPRGDSPTVAVVPDAATAAMASPAPPKPVRATGPGGRKSLWMLVVLLVLLIGLGAHWTYQALSKHDETVQLLDKGWTRQVNVEHYTAVRASDWCDNLPAGAYGVSSQREQRGTRQVDDGQSCHTVRTDVGDGTFTQRQECSPRYRDEPVYDQRCSYRINRWQVLRTDTLQGDATLAPTWPTPLLPHTLSSGSNTLGAQRLGSREERYTVQLQSAQGQQWTCPVEAALWARLVQGHTLTLKVRGTGQAVCDSLDMATPP